MIYICHKELSEQIAAITKTVKVVCQTGLRWKLNKYTTSNSGEHFVLVTAMFDKAFFPDTLFRAKMLLGGESKELVMPYEGSILFRTFDLESVKEAHD